MNYQHDWDITEDPNTLGINIVNFHFKEGQKEWREYIDLFPFRSGYISNGYRENDFFILQITEKSAGVPEVGTLKNTTLINSAKRIFKSNNYLEFEEVYKQLKELAYDFTKFTYIGKIKNNKLSGRHVTKFLFSWHNELVAPQIQKMAIK